MSRNGSGIYSLPAVYDVSDGDTSTATQITTPFEDLETDANTARPVVAGGTGATTAAAARTNLNVYSKTETDAAIAGGFSGPDTSVDGNFASFDGTGGDTLKDSGKSSASFATAAQGALADSALQSTDTFTDALVGRIQAPANGTYMLALNVPFGFTITQVTTKCESGTCTATFKINTTALGGTANSVSSTETSQAQASANVGAAGDDIQVTISSNSSCVGLSFRVKYTRALS